MNYYLDNKYSTLTNFAGTFAYCSPEMQKLQYTTQEYINLYANDHYSLRKTLEVLQKGLIKSRSDLTRNPMSSGEEQSLKSVSFNEDNEENIQLNENQTNSSYPQTTGRSLLSISSNYMPPPTKYSTSVNYIESEIIYDICRHLEKNQLISSVQIKKTVNSVRQKYQIQEDEIFMIIQKELMILFNEEDKKQLLKISQWKHTCRHYGQTHPQPLELFFKLEITISSELQLSIIKGMMEKTSIEVKYNTQYMEFLKQKRHYAHYTYGLIAYVTYALHNHSFQKQSDMILYSYFVAEQFLFMSKESRSSYQYQYKILERVCEKTLQKYGDKRIIQQIDEKKVPYITSSLAFYCCLYLQESYAMKNIPVAYFLQLLENNQFRTTNNPMNLAVTIINRSILKLNDKPQSISLVFLWIIHHFCQLDLTKYLWVWKEWEEIYMRFSHLQKKQDILLFNCLRLQILFKNGEYQKVLSLFPQYFHLSTNQNVEKSVQVSIESWKHKMNGDILQKIKGQKDIIEMD